MSGGGIGEAVAGRLEKMWALETEAAVVKPKPAKTARPRRAKKPA
jgi:hypothetical protein